MGAHSKITGQKHLPVGINAESWTENMGISHEYHSAPRRRTRGGIGGKLRLAGVIVAILLVAYAVTAILEKGTAEEESTPQTGAGGIAQNILASVQPTLETMMKGFAREVQQLRDLGAKDIILDPGFGFGKNLIQNYQIYNEMEKLNVMELPVLVGISRKSMIYKLLGGDATTSLNGTSVLDTIALMKGASILRVHDVKEAAEAVKIIEAMKEGRT